MRARSFGVCLLFVFGACVKSAPPPDAKPPAPDAGPSEADLIAPRVDALEREVAEVVYRGDEALWKHWTLGVPLDPAAVVKGHETLVSKESLELLSRARVLRPQDAQRIDALSRWVAGELLARGVAVEAEAIASLEASATFQVDGKDVPLRDLSRWLLSEKSALKRRAIWQASHPAAQRIDVALAAREQKLAQVLAGLSLPGPLEYAARSRGLDLAELERTAEATLEKTEVEWKAALQALSDAEVKLPLAGLSRADLPRLLKVPSAIDAEFPRTQVAPRLVQTLGTLGLYGKSGLTLELSEAAKKNPLPLTLTPARGEVRVSIRPLGGLRDQHLALSELGTAVWLYGLRDQPLTSGRLAPPLEAQVSAERFALLLLDRDWLQANGVKNVDAVVAQAKAQRLFVVRRAAGVVLARLAASRAEDDSQARGAFVLVMGRALQVPLAAEEGARWRLETDDFLRNATLLEAMVRAETEGPPRAAARPAPPAPEPTPAPAPDAGTAG